MPHKNRQRWPRPASPIAGGGTRVAGHGSPSASDTAGGGRRRRARRIRHSSPVRERLERWPNLGVSLLAFEPLVGSPTCDCHRGIRLSDPHRLELQSATEADRRSFRHLVLGSAMPFLGIALVPVVVVATSGLGVVVVPVAILAILYGGYAGIILFRDRRPTAVPATALLESAGSLVRDHERLPVWGRLVVSPNSINFRPSGRTRPLITVSSEQVARLSCFPFGLPPKRCAIYVELVNGERWAIRTTASSRRCRQQGHVLT